MKEMLLNIRRTPFQSVSVFLLQFFGAFLLLIAISSTAFLTSIFNRVEVQIPVIVYFKPTTPEGDIFRIRQSLIESKKTGSIDYINKQAAYEFYKSQNKDNPLLLEMTSAENFPPSLHIQAQKPEYLNEIAQYLKQERGVDEVQFEKETVDRLVVLTRILRLCIFILATYLAVMTFVTLVTMVMFKIALRKDEIELNQLLGATTARITKPFFDEGNFLAVLATFTASGVFGVLIVALRDSFSSYLAGIGTLSFTIERVTFQTWPLDPTTLAILFGIVLTYMIVISLLSTKVATRKYIT